MERLLLLGVPKNPNGQLKNFLLGDRALLVKKHSSTETASSETQNQT